MSVHRGPFVALLMSLSPFSHADQACITVPSIEGRGGYLHCIDAPSAVRAIVPSNQFSPSAFGGGYSPPPAPERSSGSNNTPPSPSPSTNPGIPSGDSYGDLGTPHPLSGSPESQRLESERPEAQGRERADADRRAAEARERDQYDARLERERLDRERQRQEWELRQRLQAESMARDVYMMNAQMRELARAEGARNETLIGNHSAENAELERLIEDAMELRSEVDSVMDRLSSWSIETGPLRAVPEVEINLDAVEDQSVLIVPSTQNPSRYAERLRESPAHPEMLNLLQFCDLGEIPALYLDTLVLNLETLVSAPIEAIGSLVPEWLLTVADIATSLTPIVGEVRDVLELVSGHDLLTGRELGQLETAWIVGSVGLLGAGRLAEPARLMFDYARNLVRSTDLRGDLVEAAGYSWIRSLKAIRTYDGVLDWHPSLPQPRLEEFRSSRHHLVRTEEPIRLWRVYDSSRVADPLRGNYWSPNPPHGRLQSEMDLALLPEWYRVDSWIEVEVPAGAELIIGIAARQEGAATRLGGGVQVWISSPRTVGMREIERGRFEN